MLKKMFFIIIAVLLLTGCNTDINLTIDDDLSNEVKVDVLIAKDELVIGDVVKNFDFEAYFNKFGKDTITSYQKTYDIFQYDYSLDNDNIYGTAITKNDTIESFISSKYINDFFEVVDFSKNEEIGTLKLSTIKKEWYINNVIYEGNINLKIKLPFVVINSNADSIKDDVYLWELDKRDNVVIKFKLNETLQEKIFTEKKKQNKIIIYGIIGIVMAIGAYVFSKIKEKKK